MARSTSIALTLAVAGAMALPLAPASAGEGAAAGRQPGWQFVLGKGTVASYAELDAAAKPTAIGMVFSPTALEGLPSGSDGHHCFDRNKDGAIDRETECNETFEFVIPLPDAAARRPDIPFRWVLLNWNPVGHGPPGIFDVPHFDVHFYIEPRIADIFAITSGPCGPEFVRCDQETRGKQPLPSNYMHPDFRVGAVAPAMGGHYRDPTDPVFNKVPFTRTWLFGGYDGKVIFYENMVTRAFLLSNPDVCDPIKSPEAVALSGFYPTVSCVRRNPSTGEYTVSIERFIYRDAAAAEPIALGK
jgi:hypothetical protein